MAEEIKRARAYYVYTTSGERLIDLSLDSGRAVLGHDALDATRTLKSLFSRGLLAAYPHPWNKKFFAHAREVFGTQDLSVVSYRDVLRAGVAEWKPYSTELMPEKDSFVASLGVEELRALAAGECRYLRLPGLPAEFPVLLIGRCPEGIECISPSPFVLALMQKSLIALRNTPTYELNPRLVAEVDKLGIARKGIYLTLDTAELVREQLCAEARKMGIFVENEKLILPRSIGVKDIKKIVSWLYVCIS